LSSNNCSINNSLSCYIRVNSRTIATTDASLTTGALNHYSASQGTFGAGTTITNQHGFIVDSTLIGATNNYGFRSSIPAGTNRWNLYMGGTANNHLAGNLLIGSTADNGSKLQVTGAATISGNVGIGTTSPYALLSVYSGSAGDRILIDSSSGSGSNGGIAWGAGSLPNISARIRGIDDGSKVRN